MLGLLMGEDDVLEFSVISQYKSITSQQAYADELRNNMYSHLSKHHKMS